MIDTERDLYLQLTLNISSLKLSSSVVAKLGYIYIYLFINFMCRVFILLTNLRWQKTKTKKNILIQKIGDLIFGS